MIFWPKIFNGKIKFKNRLFLVRPSHHLSPNLVDPPPLLLVTSFLNGSYPHWAFLNLRRLGGVVNLTHTYFFTKKVDMEPKRVCKIEIVSIHSKHHGKTFRIHNSARTGLVLNFFYQTAMLSFPTMYHALVYVRIYLTFQFSAYAGVTSRWWPGKKFRKNVRKWILGKEEELGSILCFVYNGWNVPLWVILTVPQSG